MFNSIVSSVKRKTEKSNKKASSFCSHCKILPSEVFSLLISYVCGRVLFDFILYNLFVCGKWT